MYPPELVQKFRSLSPVERTLFIRAWFLLSWHRLRLMIATRGRVARRTRDAMSGGSGDYDAAMVAFARRRMSILNRAAAYHVIDTNCLVRAFTGLALLADHGIRASLKIGVAREPGSELRAHAWLELCGQVISEDDAVTTRFVPMTDIAQLPQNPRHWK